MDGRTRINIRGSALQQRSAGGGLPSPWKLLTARALTVRFFIESMREKLTESIV